MIRRQRVELWPSLLFPDQLPQTTAAIVISGSYPTVSKNELSTLYNALVRCFIILTRKVIDAHWLKLRSLINESVTIHRWVTTWCSLPWGRLFILISAFLFVCSSLYRAEAS